MTQADGIVFTTGMRSVALALGVSILILNCKARNDCQFADPSCSPASLLFFRKIAYPRLVYAGNLGGNSITSYRIDYSTGLLTALGSTGVTGPASISIHPNGKILYASNTGSSTTYVVNESTGGLALGTTIGGNAVGLMSDPSGRFGYRLNAGGALLETYLLNGDDGGMTFVSSTGVTNAPNMGAMHSSGRVIYLADTTGNRIATFSVNPDTGATSLLGYTSLPVARGLAIDPFGRFLYGTDNTNILKVFRIDSDGLPSQIGTAPTGTFNTFVAASPSGRFAYVTNQTSVDVSAMSIDALGTVTNVANRAAGLGPIGVAVETTGKFLFIGNAGANTISVYSINQTTGDITVLQTIASANGTQSFAFVNELRF